MQQQLHESQQSAAELSYELSHELDLLKQREPSASSSRIAELQQQTLCRLEGEVAQIANRLLEASLSLQNISIAERRQLRQAVNELLTLDFHAADP